MNKTQLVQEFAAKTSVKPSAAEANIAQLMQIFTDALKAGDEVTLPGIGKLKISTRPGRNGRNPSTGAAIVIPAKRVVKFSPASTFSEAVQAVPEAPSA